MIKKYLPVMIVTSVVVLLPMVFGLIFWGKLPDPMPSHFNSSGEVDGYMPKAAMVFGLPGAMFILHFICTAITLADPKRRNIDGKPFLMVLWIAPAVSIAITGAVYAFAMGYKINVTTIAMVIVSIMLIILGNYLPKCGQNYSIGIKTPWALNDEDNWRATHRFGGKVCVAVGFITLIFALCSMASQIILWLYIPITIVAAAAPMLYSYVYYLKHPKNKE